MSELGACPCNRVLLDAEGRVRFIAGMSKTFRPCDVEQRWLLPPSVHELVAAGHVAHFVRETVREELDLSAILSTYSKSADIRPTIRR
jgi:hypothetical protein